MVPFFNFVFCFINIIGIVSISPAEGGMIQISYTLSFFCIHETWVSQMSMGRGKKRKKVAQRIEDDKN